MTISLGWASPSSSSSWLPGLCRRCCGACAFRARPVDAAPRRALSHPPESAKASDSRPTVFLPRTDFPMRGDLPKREPVLLERWRSMDLYGRLRARAKGRPKFVLHDGPPYANGNLHIGHALNKILKDVINRGRQMGGYDAHYIPGWDCHGLPIEGRIEEECRKSGRDKDAVPILKFRQECRAYAEHWMGVQRDKFQLNGALYRGLRPVMWSPVEKTALAEAEIEYHDHTSTTIWVRFPIVAGPAALAGASVVIWTTSPWTMPGNRAIACGAGFD